MGIFDDITGGIADVTKEATKVVAGPVVAPIVGVASGLKETIEDAIDGVAPKQSSDSDKDRGGR